MSRLIDADALKADYGMKDDCKDCEKDTPGYVRNCQYNTVYSKMDFCGWIDSAPTIEPERTGKWIRWYETKEDETGTEYIPHCRCSECGTEYDPHSSKFVSFCNVCGARMES